MNKSIMAIGSLAVLLTGCQNPDGTTNNAATGALAGGAVGALTGAAIGGRHGGQDALMGTAAGVLAGGLIGLIMDNEQKDRLKAQAPQTYAHVDLGQPLSVPDVKALAKAGITEDVIISQIANSHTVYHLSSADIIDLRDSGVTDKVINFMINTPSMVAATPPPAPAVAVAPPGAPVETVAVAPGPDYVWVGGEYVWQGGGWIWVGGHWMVPPHPHAVWVVGRSWHDGYGWHHERGYWR
jgi:outer membrane lipoprotein SlyB